MSCNTSIGWPQAQGAVQGAFIKNNAPVSVSAVAVTFAPANSSRIELRVTNLGPDPVTIGAVSGLTWAGRTLVLYADETWVETTVPGDAWAAVTAAATTAAVTAQEILV